jgi:hypothetical protein
MYSTVWILTFHNQKNFKILIYFSDDPLGDLMTSATFEIVDNSLQEYYNF